MNAPMHQAASTPALAVLADQLALIAVQDLPQPRFELLRGFLQVAAQPGATQADISTASGDAAWICSTRSVIPGIATSTAST